MKVVECNEKRPKFEIEELVGESLIRLYADEKTVHRDGDERQPEYNGYQYTTYEMTGLSRTICRNVKSSGPIILWKRIIPKLLSSCERNAIDCSWLAIGRFCPTRKPKKQNGRAIGRSYGTSPNRKGFRMMSSGLLHL